MAGLPLQGVGSGRFWRAVSRWAQYCRRTAASASPGRIRQRESENASENQDDLGESVMTVKRTRLVARRKAVGFSQDQLAERLKVDRSTVARWECGESTPQPWSRPQMAK